MNRSTLAWLPLLLGLALPAPSGAAGGRGADGDFDVRTSSHFVLHQDVAIDETGGFYGSRRFEQQVLDTLESAYESLDRLLGVRPRRKLDVVIYDPRVFDQTFSGLFRFQAAGFYAGVIRVRGTTELTVPLRRVLHHELAHAAFDAEAPSLVLPAWVNEGGAEWFEARALGKRGLSAGEWNALRQLRQQGALYSLAQLSTPSFAGFAQVPAQIAYLQSYAVIDHLARSHGERSVARFYEELLSSRDLDRSIQRVFRDDLGDVERAFLAEIH